MSSSTPSDGGEDGAGGDPSEMPDDSSKAERASISPFWRSFERSFCVMPEGNGTSNLTVLLNNSIVAAFQALKLHAKLKGHSPDFLTI